MSNSASATTRPFFLLTGDDSVRAEGLILVKRIVEQFADFAIVATKNQQSAVGSKITFPGCQWGKEIVDGVEAIWVDGSPTDAVFFAFDYLERKPDFVLSGMNRGTNFGNLIHRSGTVAAVVTAAQNRATPGIAFSSESKDMDWLQAHDGSFDESKLAYPGKIIEKIIQQALQYSFPKDTFWNVNFPDEPTEEIVIAPTGPPNYWVNHQKIDTENHAFTYIDQALSEFPAGCDIEQMLSGKITLTPCRVEYTDYTQLKALENIFKNYE